MSADSIYVSRVWLDQLLADKAALTARVVELEGALREYANQENWYRSMVKDKDAEIRRLREALEPFAKVADNLEFLPDEQTLTIELGAIRRAAKALEG
jgi:hypothetical protein